jgi:hypothetical protein
MRKVRRQKSEGRSERRRETYRRVGVAISLIMDDFHKPQDTLTYQTKLYPNKTLPLSKNADTPTRRYAPLRLSLLPSHFSPADAIPE